MRTVPYQYGTLTGTLVQYISITVVVFFCEKKTIFTFRSIEDDFSHKTHDK